MKNKTVFMKPTQNQKTEKQATFKPNKPQSLTPELLRSSSGLHDLTDEQVTENYRESICIGQNIANGNLA